jgi:hypothetical protein
MSDSSLSLLNVFEVERDGAMHHLVCFLDPVLAGARGIDGRAVIGEFTPAPNGDFDHESFQVNPEFIAAFEQFMNEEAARSSELANQARNHPGGRLYIVDARHPGDPRDDLPTSEVAGSFTVEETGQIVPGSFQYNHDHVWFHPDTGSSSLLANRQFYDWLHLGKRSQDA